MKRISRRVVGGALLALAVVPFLGGVVQFILPESFGSTARISLPEPRPPAGAAPAAADAVWMSTQVEIIQSASVLEKVVGRLQLNRAWGKKFKEPGDLSTQLTCEILKRMLAVRQVPKTRLIEISAYSEDPKEAALIANTIAQVFREVREEAEPAPTPGPAIASPPAAARAGIQIVDQAEPGLRPVRPTVLTKAGFLAASALLTLFGLLALFSGPHEARPTQD